MSVPSAMTTPTPVWSARTGTHLAEDFLAYSETTAEDAPYVAYDVQGSIAHVAGLHHVGLLAADEAEALITGLQDLAARFKAGTWTLDPALEDVHMNLESALGTTVGDAAKRIHTGRSRNDQVATCITLFARDHLTHLAAGALALSQALAQQATQHAATPWVARTHGQPAQPATLGFLLAAHALRVQTVAKQALQAFHALADSPLGCGAVAGSTLPLDPGHTAVKLGLRAPKNALLATGTRDTALTATQVAAHAGIVAAGLAQDLIDLFTTGALALPDGFTSGSSMMPQKRNPDALELARGKGRALAGPHAEIAAVCAGLGLGYQRDLQVTKPPLTRAMTDAVATYGILAQAVQGATFNTRVLAASYATPGITATDAAEALVAIGMPFREAYGHLAAFHAHLEQGKSPDQALQALGLESDAETALASVLVPDATRRATTGGPAPETVLASLADLATCQATTALMVESAQTEVQVAAGLLTTPAAEVLA